MPTRIDGELFAAAKSSGALHSRSAAQQIDHWARIGRELEASADVSHRDIDAVLTDKASHDVVMVAADTPGGRVRLRVRAPHRYGGVACLNPRSPVGLATQLRARMPAFSAVANPTHSRYGANSQAAARATRANSTMTTTMAASSATMSTRAQP